MKDHEVGCGCIHFFNFNVGLGLQSFGLFREKHPYIGDCIYLTGLKSHDSGFRISDGLKGHIGKKRFFAPVIWKPLQMQAVTRHGLFQGIPTSGNQSLNVASLTKAIGMDDGTGKIGNFFGKCWIRSCKVKDNTPASMSLYRFHSIVDPGRVISGIVHDPLDALDHVLSLEVRIVVKRDIRSEYKSPDSAFSGAAPGLSQPGPGLHISIYEGQPFPGSCGTVHQGPALMAFIQIPAHGNRAVLLSGTDYPR
jgi:hypothetical protein